VELFPNCVTESATGKAIDFDLLKQELSHAVVEGNKERYRLEWPGKREAIVTANLPTTKTLRPVREDSVDFDNTENIYIEGDNLEVLKLLQESYLGKIKMIYIDPPYNTGRDFVYKDNFHQSDLINQVQSGFRDELNKRLIVNPDTSGRFHSDWLSMIFPRLKIARNLLRDDGVIFISIDDNEVDNLKKICNEIFGEENFIGCAGRITKKSNNKGDFWAPNFDYLLTYTKNIALAEEFFGGANISAYNLSDDDGPRKGEKYQLVRLYMSTIQNRNPEQRFWIECPDGSKVIPPGKTFPPERPELGDGIWRWTRKKFEEEKDKIVIKQVRSSNLVTEDGSPAKWNVFTKTYLNDVIDNSSAKPNSFIEDHINQKGSHEINELGIKFDYSKPSSLIKFLMEICKVKKDDVVMDFFGGSSTTADSLLQLNASDIGKRKFIMVQIPEPSEENSEVAKAGFKTISDLGKERIRRAAKKIKEETGADIDYGFRVYRLDESNMQDVYYRPQDFDQGKMDLFGDNVKPERTEDDLLSQVMLDWGLPLSLKIEQVNVSGKKVFKVAENSLFACFDKGIDDAFAKEIAKEKPLRIVFKDAGFKDDTAKTNVKQLLKQLSPETEMKVL